MKRAHTLVIGAGPAGLSLAYHLQGDTLILEKEDKVGGLCRSFHLHGGVFDIGGHSFHTPFPEVRVLVTNIMDGNLDMYQRDARVYTHGTLIPYPFQKFFEQVPDPEVIEECRAGLQDADPSPEPDNFEEYILRRFGPGVAKHFMLPYNRKLWGPDLKRMSCQWTSERIAGVKGSKEEFKRTGGKRTPLQAGTYMQYPSKGGMEEIYKRLAARVPVIELNQKVVRIDPQRKVACAANGEKYRWERLVSTMPLPELLRVVEGTPSELLELVGRLDYLSLRVEFLLIGRQLLEVPQRIYIADPEIPPHKVVFNHASSAYLKELTRHAVVAEVSYSREKAIERETIAQRTIEALIEMGILRSVDDVMWQDHVEVKYAYPVYTHERTGIVQAIKRYLESFDIYTLGRFGDWEYINSDHCIWKGMELARQLAQHKAAAL